MSAEPWRALLWCALLSVHSNGAHRPANILDYEWTDTHFDQPTLGSDMLIAWSLLRPRNIGSYIPPGWSFVGAALHINTLPALPDCTRTTVCGDIPLAQLTVQKAYSYLLRQDFATHWIKPPAPLPLSAAFWPARWTWVRSSPMPIKVRQTLWRRWHNKLYLGPLLPLTEDIDLTEDFGPGDPACPYNEHHRDSPLHFVYNCPPITLGAHAFLSRCWTLWTGSVPSPLWVMDEWAGSENRGWSLAFACLVHALYAGRMHRMDPKSAHDGPLDLLLYVLALFKKQLTGTIHAALGNLLSLKKIKRCNKLGWPASWITRTDGVAKLTISWPPFPTLLPTTAPVSLSLRLPPPHQAAPGLAS